MYHNLKLWKNLTKANDVCNKIKEKYQIESLKIYLNNENEDIKVGILYSELSRFLIKDIEKNLCSTFQNQYKITPAPDLSYSYSDNPIQKEDILYHFQKIGNLKCRRSI